jgi:tetratricopeptide (TPR) repeat protein
MAQRERTPGLFAATMIVGGLLLAQQPAAMDLLDQATAKADELCRSGRFSEAAEVMKPAVQAAEKAGPSTSHLLAGALTTLGRIYHNQCRYAEAERLLRRAMGIWEGNPASDMRWRLRTANSLAAAYSATGRFALSERLLRQHLSIGRNLHADCPEIAKVFQELGYAQEGQRRYAEAESSFRESLVILQRLPGHDHDVADVLTTLGDFQLRAGRHREALENLEGALAIYSRLYSEAHPDTLEPSLSLARVYVAIGQPLEAERLLKQALVTANTTVGPEHPLTGVVFVHYARVLRVLGRRPESAKLEREGKAILDKSALADPRGYTIDVTELLAEQGRR